jgi:hypothetical protein
MNYNPREAFERIKCASCKKEQLELCSGINEDCYKKHFEQQNEQMLEGRQHLSAPKCKEEA